MPSGSRIRSAFSGVFWSTAVMNRSTLSAADDVSFGRRLIEATITLRGPGAETGSSVTSSHQTVPCGAFDKYNWRATEPDFSGAWLSSVTRVHSPSRRALYT